MEFLVVAATLPESLSSVLMVVGLVVSAGILFLTFRVARRETPIRPGFDVAGCSSAPASSCSWG
jgi:hypothetical protein